MVSSIFCIRFPLHPILIAPNLIGEWVKRWNLMWIGQIVLFGRFCTELHSCNCSSDGRSRFGNPANLDGFRRKMVKIHSDIQLSSSLSLFFISVFFFCQESTLLQPLISWSEIYLELMCTGKDFLVSNLNFPGLCWWFTLFCLILVLSQNKCQLLIVLFQSDRNSIVQ